MTGQELREWRATHGYDQVGLALALHVTPWAISQWETERRKIPAFLYLALERLACEIKRSPPITNED